LLAEEGGGIVTEPLEEDDLLAEAAELLRLPVALAEALLA
jgi:hypothetical protein